MSVERVQLRRTKGWRMPPNTLKVDRSTRWGNPFTPQGYWDAGYSGSLDVALMHCVEAFEAWASGGWHWAFTGAFLIEHPRPDLAPLRGKNLACWCPIGKPCHADVLLRLANEAQQEGSGDE